MKVRTVEIREGELLGPVDPNYDYRQHCGVTRPVDVEKAWAIIKTLKVGDRVRVSHSDMPKEVIAVGMYDGWPYWTPTPAFRVACPVFGAGDWHTFTWLREKL